MKIEQDDIEVAALELWTEVFKAQCSLPPTDEGSFARVAQAETVANHAERAFRARIAKVPT